MLQQDGFMWEYRIPGSVMVKGGMKVLLMGFVAAYLLGEVVSWFFRSSFTLVLINAAKKGEIGVQQLGGQFGLHRFFAPGLGIADEPANGQGNPAVGSNLYRHLVGGAAYPS